MNCSKCDKTMEKGFLLDAAFGGARKAVWVRGDELPVIKITALPPSVEITGERYELAAFRCTSCGLVETYATEQV